MTTQSALHQLFFSTRTPQFIIATFLRCPSHTHVTKTIQIDTKITISNGHNVKFLLVSLFIRAPNLGFLTPLCSKARFFVFDSARKIRDTNKFLLSSNPSLTLPNEHQTQTEHNSCVLSVYSDIQTNETWSKA